MNDMIAMGVFLTLMIAILGYHQIKLNKKKEEMFYE